MNLYHKPISRTIIQFITLNNEVKKSFKAVKSLFLQNIIYHTILHELHKIQSQDINNKYFYKRQEIWNKGETQAQKGEFTDLTGTEVILLS